MELKGMPLPQEITDLYKDCGNKQVPLAGH